MITAQDIREKTFDKAKFNNGYDMASVDEFLEELADEITAAQKENAVLKSKMKVLVANLDEMRSKLDDSHADKEAINLAILSAQKLAVQVETDARTRAAAMIADAQKTVDATIGTIKEQAAEQERRLAAAEAATKKFCESVRAMCAAQVKNIDTIENGLNIKAAPAEKEAPKAAEEDEDIKIAPVKAAPAAKSVDSTRSFSFDL